VITNYTIEPWFDEESFDLTIYVVINCAYINSNTTPNEVTARADSMQARARGFHPPFWSD
jgi:hypothetical protein